MGEKGRAVVEVRSLVHVHILPSFSCYRKPDDFASLLVPIDYQLCICNYFVYVYRVLVYVLVAIVHA